MSTFGEITIELGDVALPLVFKTRNLREISKITGKPTMEFFSAFLSFDPESATDLKQIAGLCDYDIFITLVRAGLTTDVRYKRQTASQFEDKICDLLDAEAAKRGSGTYPVLMEKTPLIVAEALKSLMPAQSASEDSGDPKNVSGVAEGVTGAEI